VRPRDLDLETVVVSCLWTRLPPFGESR